MSAVGGFDFATWLAPTIDAQSSGYARLSLPVRPDFLDHRGRIVVPVLTGLVEATMIAATPVDDGVSARLSDLTCHLIALASVEVLVAEARVLRAGRRLVVLETAVQGYANTQAHAHADIEQAAGQPLTEQPDTVRVAHMTGSLLLGKAAAPDRRA